MGINKHKLSFFELFIPKNVPKIILILLVIILNN